MSAIREELWRGPLTDYAISVDDGRELLATGIIRERVDDSHYVVDLKRPWEKRYTRFVATVDKIGEYRLWEWLADKAKHIEESGLTVRTHPPEPQTEAEPVF